MLLLLHTLTACGEPPPPAERSGWRIGFVAPEGSGGEAALRGAELGALEAARVGALVNRRLELEVARATGPEATVRAARRLHSRGAVAIIGGLDEPTCRAVSTWAEGANAIFLNVGCRSDDLRASAEHTFHVEASESMYREAGGSAEGEPVIWHPDLTRYGAAQLNDRFVRELGTHADAHGWTSWMAVKVLWEALLKVGAPDADSLASYLASDAARFDGHKGEPLGFDPLGHQLQQPLYLVDPTDSSLLAARPGAAREATTLPRADSVGLEGGPYVFVSNEGSDDVTVIDADAQRAIARIPIGDRPRGIHMSPDGRRLYVALSDDAPTRESDGDAIAVVELPSGVVTVRHAAGSDPEQFALSPDGRLLYASNEDAGTASITDLATGEVLAMLVVGIEPEGVAVSPDGRWVYVTAETSNTVSVIDTQEAEVVASFLVDVRPRGVAFSPTLPRAYVTNEISGTVSVIDTRDHRVIATVTLDGDRAKPVGVAVSPDGARVYVANGYAHSVSVIDAGTNEVVEVVPVGQRPWGITVSADGSRVYTANGGTHDVSVIDAAELRVIGTVPVGERPWGVTVSP